MDAEDRTKDAVPGASVHLCALWGHKEGKPAWEVGWASWDGGYVPVPTPSASALAAAGRGTRCGAHVGACPGVWSGCLGCTGVGLGRMYGQSMEQALLHTWHLPVPTAASAAHAAAGRGTRCGAHVGA